MSMTAKPRTRLETDAETIHRITADAARDVYVITPDDRAPLVIVPKTDTKPERAFDLSDVRTFTHEWLDDDGLDDDDPDVTIRSADHTDEILIRGVVERMVSIDHAPYVEENPRLLIWTEHRHDDQPPTAVPL